MIGKKRKEAIRLARQYKKDCHDKATIRKLNFNYLITIQIKGKPFSYIIGLEETQGTIEERNLKFARFLVNSIEYYNQYMRERRCGK